MTHKEVRDIFQKSPNFVREVLRIDSRFEYFLSKDSRHYFQLQEISPYSGGFRLHALFHTNTFVEGAYDAGWVYNLESLFEDPLSITPEEAELFRLEYGFDYCQDFIDNKD